MPASCRACGRPISSPNKLLNNRTNLGEAVHKGQSIPGEHQAIVSRALWDRVRGILTESPRARANRNRRQTPALLLRGFSGPSRACT
jgi:site-specific DNA recombinase